MNVISVYKGHYWALIYWVQNTKLHVDQKINPRNSISLNWKLIINNTNRADDLKYCLYFCQDDFRLSCQLSGLIYHAKPLDGPSKFPISINFNSGKIFSKFRTINVYNWGARFSDWTYSAHCSILNTIFIPRSLRVTCFHFWACTCFVYLDYGIMTVWSFCKKRETLRPYIQ